MGVNGMNKKDLKDVLQIIYDREMYSSLVIISKNVKKNQYKYLFYFKNDCKGEIVSDRFVLIEAMEQELGLEHIPAVSIYHNCHQIEFEDLFIRFNEN